jgi:hypothetical protein
MFKGNYSLGLILSFANKYNKLEQNKTKGLVKGRRNIGCVTAQKSGPSGDVLIDSI